MRTSFSNMFFLRCIYIFQLIILSVFGIHLPNKQSFPTHSVQIQVTQQYWLAEQNRIDFPQFPPDDWFPIEINVPDTIESAWHGFETVWTAASEFFFMNNQEAPQNLT